VSALEPPAAITPEVFAEWRTVRRGRGQAQQLTNPLWAWMVETGHGPYVVNEHFDGEPSCDAGPGWTNDRFGQSTTRLSDGRTVLIGGEHEDYYDADFHIYNDVIVRTPDGAVEILGYDEASFPPTDFHTATLVGDRIMLVGSLGYPGRRAAGSTQVLELDTQHWHVRTVDTTGDGPGWIHRHDTRLGDDGRLLVTGGRIWIDDGTASGALIDNGDDWELDARFTWRRLTDRGWQHWRIERVDRQPSAAWQLRTSALAAGRNDATSGALADLYDLPVAHRRLPSTRPEDFNVVRMSADGTDVRCTEDMGGITVTIEGPPASEVVDAIVEHLRSELSQLDGAPHDARRLD